MKKIIGQLCLSLLILPFYISILSSQHYHDRKGILLADMMNLMQARYGVEYKYVEYSILDTAIHYSTKEKNFRRQDPYNTLKGCILFSTYKGHRESEPDTFIVGMVKNGKIIWDNAPGTSANLGGQLLYSQDINNDGEVDLIYSEVDEEMLTAGRPPFLFYIYILSWNGSRGRFINAFDSTGTSILIGEEGCDLISTTKGGIKEITTVLPNLDLDWGYHKTSTFPRITYSWNGKLYGLWSKTKSTNAK